MSKSMKKGMAWFLSLILMLSVVVTGNYKIAKAATRTVSLTGSFTYDASNGTEAPNNWGIAYDFYSDNTCNTVIPGGSYISLNSSDSTIDVSDSNIEDTARYIKLTFTTAGTPTTSATINGVNIDVNNPYIMEIPADGGIDINIVMQKANGGNNPPPSAQGDTDVTFTLIKNEAGREPVFDEYVNIMIGNLGDSSGSYRDEAVANNNTFTIRNLISSQNPPQTIVLSPDFGITWNSAKINGQQAEIRIDSFGNQYVEFALPVDLSQGVTCKLEVTVGQSDDVTMAWAYSTATNYYQGADTLVEHGKVELVSITRQSQTIYKAGDDISEVDISSQGGYVQLKRGDDVVVKIIPDYGYQLKSVTINDQTLIPQAGVSTFELPNIQGNLHFSGAFVKSEDVIANSSKTVSAATIGGGASVADSGNLSLTIKDNATYTKDAASAADGEAEKVTSLELTLDNIVSKGNGSYWTSNLTELKKPVTLSVDIDGELAEGESYSIVRDHNGKLEELECTYDENTGVLSFETDKFSTYTIVKKTKVETKETEVKKPTTPSTTTTTTATNTNTTSPKTGDGFDMRVLAVMLLSGLGILVLRKKREM